MHWLRHAQEYGANRFRAADADQQLASDVAGFQIGEDQHVGSALQRGEGECRFHLLGTDGDVALYLTIDDEGGVGIAHQVRCPPYLVAQRMLGAAEAGEGEHGHARLNVEPARLFGRAESDLCQVLGGGFNVDRGIGQEVRLALAGDDEIKARDLVDPFANPDHLQRRTNRVGIILGHAGNDGVGVSHADHHGAEDVVIVQRLGGRAQCHAATLSSANELMNDHNIFGSMMVRMGDADAVVSGVTQNYPDTIRPALQVIGVREGIHKVSGLYLIITRKGKPYFLADATVNIEPTAEDLAEIALCAAEEARRFDIEPRVAMLSFSSFGSTKHPLCDKIRRATDLVRYADPTLIIDGEIQGDSSVSPKKMEAAFPFSPLQGGANVLIFPNLEASNIACKLLISVGGAEAVGPILLGMAKPVHLLALGAEVEEIINMTTIAVVDAQDSVVPVGHVEEHAFATVG